MREIKISLETAQRWFNGADNELKQLALQTYPELAKKELPKKWEVLDVIKGFYINNTSIICNSYTATIPNNRNVFATFKQAESIIAMAKLSQVMAVYNDGWVADWSNVMQDKWRIVFHLRKPMVEKNIRYKEFLTFKTEELAEEFLTNFREDIETYFNF